MGNISLKIAIISNLNNSDNNTRSVSISLKEYLIYNIKDVDIAIMSTDTYYIVYHLKIAHVFAISL